MHIWLINGGEMVCFVLRKRLYGRRKMLLRIDGIFMK